MANGVCEASPGLRAPAMGLCRAELPLGMLDCPSLLGEAQAWLDGGLSFALLVLACDRSKEIRDTLGEEAGDQLLRLVGERLRDSVRHGDAMKDPLACEEGQRGLTARLTGDRFIVAALGVGDDSAALALAQRLIAKLARPLGLGGLEVATTVSLGVTLSAGRTDAADMLRDAQTAILEAERRGGGKSVVFEPQLNRRRAAELELEADLRHALASGQIRVVFQPIVELWSGEVAGFEALARWRHPVRGEIGPAHFIPVAESSGLIGELGQDVLRLASREFAQLRAQGLALNCRLSVNLSRAQLADPGFAAEVEALLDEVSLPPECLQLEITESLAMRDESTRKALAALRSLGVRLSLDDFGTGHSSLASLNEFPVQQVKIDRTFVCDLETSRYHQALVRACIQMASALDLEVVAEGVETVEQARQLHALGCDKAQGWFYSKALETTDVPAFLSRPPVLLHAADPNAGRVSAGAEVKAGFWSRQERAPTLSSVLARGMWVPRLAGLSLGSLVVASVLWDQGRGPVAWAGLGIHALVWPWLARWWIRSSKSPMVDERRNLLLDSVFAAAWLPMMEFQALPSVVLLAMLTMQNVAAGGWRLGVKGVGCQLAGIAGGMLIAGVAFTSYSSPMTVMLSLGFVFLYSAAVGAVSHESAKSVNRKRLQLMRSEKIQREILNAMEAGIVLYDADDRLVLWNHEFEKLYEPIAHLIVTGMTFEQLVELEVEHGIGPQSKGSVQAWKEERLRQHRHSNQPINRQMADGSWRRIVEQRLPTGGLLSFSTELTGATAK